MASEAHKKWGGHSQYGNKKWGGSATSLAIELTLFLANSGAAMAASAAAAPTPMMSNLNNRTPSLNSPKDNVLYKEDRIDISSFKLPIQMSILYRIVI